MKSLEEVIKYKLNFLPIGIDPFYAIQTYTAERGTNPPSSYYDIYRTKNTIFLNDSLSFMEDITPLFIYISSCDKYYRENGHGKIEWIEIYSFMVDGEILKLGSSSPHNEELVDLEEYRISNFKRCRNAYFSRVGYYACYTAPFKILFRGGFNHFLTEEERLQREVEIREAEEAYYRGVEEGQISLIDYSDSDDNDDEEKEELSINDFKTFKLEQCVICLEEKPKVLFCNCGHLCICEKCLVRRFDNCPVCKKKNTILRIIE